jgi:hypothetical protein
MLFIKLNLRIKAGYHPADTQANSETVINIDRIDYYYDDPHGDGYMSTVCINGHEFRCTESVAEIKEKIELAKIADSVK